MGRRFFTPEYNWRHYKTWVPGKGDLSTGGGSSGGQAQDHRQAVHRRVREESRRIKDVEFLAQGTIYPDVIESADGKTGKAHVITSHHNVGGLPAHMRLKLVKPLRELFKDEVRRIGLEPGLPAEMVHRHPFPGLGSASWGRSRR